MSWIALWLVAEFSLARHSTPPAALCHQQALDRKDCTLVVSPYHVQVSKLKISWNDGAWTSIADLPMPGDDVQWEKMELTHLGGHWLLEFWIWDAGVGAAKVESLHWIVGELKDKKFTGALNEIVRKREVKVFATPVSYSYDRMRSHGLKLDSKGIHWNVEKKTGSLSPK